MKRFIVLVVALVAIMGFGGHMATAHAETLTPAQAAALNQTLDALKARLATLQAQAAALNGQPAAPAQSPAYALSEADRAALKSALGTLAVALSNLQSEVAAHPELAAGREGAITVALQGIGASLSKIGVVATGKSLEYSPLPSAAQPSGSDVSSGPSPVTTPTPSPIAQTPAASFPSGEQAGSPATAQVSASWSWKNVNWPLVIVIGLIVLAMGLWLFWPTEDEEKKKIPVAAKSNLSRESAKPAPHMEQPAMSMAKPGASSPTPLSTAVGGSPMPAPQSQQRKPA